MVLPEPVRPRPRTSRPARESGSVAAWMGVGSVMPAREHLGELGGHAELDEGCRQGVSLTMWCLTTAMTTCVVE